MKKVLVAFVMLCSVMLGLVIPTNQAAAFDTNCTTRFLGLPAWYDGLVDTGTCEIESPAKDEAKLRQFIWTVVANIMALVMGVVGYLAIAFVILLLLIISSKVFHLKKQSAKLLINTCFRLLLKQGVLILKLSG